MSDLPHPSAPPREAAPVPGAILETALYARDLDAAEGFYGGVIGLEKAMRLGNRHLFFRIGAAMLLIFNPEETVRPPQDPALPVPPHGATGAGHVCFALSRDEIARMRRRLVDAGQEIEAEFDWPNGARSLYLRDPAGNSVEFAEPRLWQG
ncbi:VOC family protein [Pseudodonghicola flavimaris]|uniref:VOC family protein n=1 Tax=Pseudodonghicola flavimaris TaxID=3050036 RepID=A0ABT7EVT8_9RHOB|nr:VOC family protein [Pseudodonghicola flavimaris]MDK3016461.1 VOC family protein [Pseudodonghicola flavimaris]